MHSAISFAAQHCSLSPQYIARKASSYKSAESKQ
jgi:hypothetical protein